MIIIRLAGAVVCTTMYFISISTSFVLPSTRQDPTNMGRLTRLLSQSSHNQPEQQSIQETRANVKPRTSFMSLPAELRSQIYTWVAIATDLSLSRGRKRYDAPGLLMTSHQIRNEYGIYLWSLARITIDIHAYDFRIVQSIVGSLYSHQLRALRTNKRLKLLLHLGKSCDRKQWELLRRWLVQRTNNIDLLPWGYEVAYQGNNLNAGDRIKYLEAHKKVITESAKVLDELTQFELYPIMGCIEAELWRSQTIEAQLRNHARR